MKSEDAALSTFFGSSRLDVREVTGSIPVGRRKKEADEASFFVVLLIHIPHEEGVS